MGSRSDWPVMKHAAYSLDALGVAYQANVVSAHRTPERMYDFAREAKAAGVKVIIAGAGGAAHLPGMTASLTDLPVLGVPVESKALKGMDSLLSIVQMPAGIGGDPRDSGAGAIASGLLAALWPPIRLADGWSPRYGKRRQNCRGLSATPPPCRCPRIDARHSGRGQRPDAGERRPRLFDVATSSGTDAGHPRARPRRGAYDDPKPLAVQPTSSPSSSGLCPPLDRTLICRASSAPGPGARRRQDRGQKTSQRPASYVAFAAADSASCSSRRRIGAPA